VALSGFVGLLSAIARITVRLASDSVSGFVGLRRGHKETRGALAAKLGEAETLIGKSLAEQWAINKSVHFNKWENLQKVEFQAVVDAFKALLERLRCANRECGTYVFVSPRKGPQEALRCNCGAININLKAK